MKPQNCLNSACWAFYSHQLEGKGKKKVFPGCNLMHVYVCERVCQAELHHGARSFMPLCSPGSPVKEREAGSGLICLTLPCDSLSRQRLPLGARRPFISESGPAASLRGQSTGSLTFLFLLLLLQLLSANPPPPSRPHCVSVWLRFNVRCLC